MTRTYTLCCLLIPFTERWTVSLELKLADCWVGFFFHTTPETAFGSSAFDLWICLLPLLPLHVQRRSRLLRPDELFTGPPRSDAIA